MSILYTENGWNALDESELCFDCYEGHFIYVCETCDQRNEGCVYQNLIVAPYDRCDCATEEGN